MTKDGLKLRTPRLSPITHAEHDANFQRLMYWSGDWAAGTYEIYEVVRHIGDSWVCIVSTTTNEPGTLVGINDWRRLSASTLEIWQATPIVGMPIGGSVIQWTFVPIFTGQTPVLLTHAAGVFTFQTNGATIEFQLNAAITQQVRANNDALEWRIAPTYSGTGINTMLPWGGSIGASRASGFPSAAIIRGGILAANGDTVSFSGSSTGDGTSDADLDAAYLQVTGPPP